MGKPKVKAPTGAVGNGAAEGEYGGVGLGIGAVELQLPGADLKMRGIAYPGGVSGKVSVAETIDDGYLGLTRVQGNCNNTAQEKEVIFHGG